METPSGTIPRLVGGGQIIFHYVEKVLDVRGHEPYLEYLVKWEGYSGDGNLTWEQADVFDKCSKVSAWTCPCSPCIDAYANPYLTRRAAVDVGHRTV